MLVVFLALIALYLLLFPVVVYFAKRLLLFDDLSPAVSRYFEFFYKLLALWSLYVFV